MDSDRPADPLAAQVIQAMTAMQRASWEQGVAAQAMWEWGDRATAVLMARDAVLRQAEDGRPSVVYTDNGVTDPAAIGETLGLAADFTGEALFSRARDRLINYLLHDAPRTEDGTLYHLLNGREIWIDSLYMAPPALAAAGEIEESLRQIEGIHRRLWDSEAGLYSHRWDEDSSGVIRRDHWGVGNGWAVAGLARVIERLPEEDPHRRRLIGRTVECLDACLALRRSDGLFHDILDDPGSFVETNLAQMLSYAIFRGVASGWLDASYLDDGRAMRKAVRSKVDENGFVQGVCGAPDFDRPGRAVEGQAFFLLMESGFQRTDGGKLEYDEKTDKSDAKD